MTKTKNPVMTPYSSGGVVSSFSALRRRLRITQGFLRRLAVAAVVIFALNDGLYRVRDWQDDRIKALPTDFSGFHGKIEPPGRVMRYLIGPRIDGQYVYMRQLGRGREGSAALYLDSSTGKLITVKTFESISRNPLPTSVAGDFEQWTSTWPSEIEAGLLLQEQPRENASVFVPVVDYFLLQPNAPDWMWTMVTPFCEGGTLQDLAKATTVHRRTPQKLDVIFRPVLHQLLQGLETLHSAGYCHDDIKPDNVFVESTTHWLLGDLGSVREVGHPWHFTRTRKEQNQWSDCQSNDVRRLLKTYLWFLRHASGDVSAFDVEFHRESQAWSQLYWRFMREVQSKEQTLALSLQLDPSRDPETDPNHLWHDPSEQDCIREMVKRELTCTTLSKRWLLTRRCDKVWRSLPARQA